jgi:uncharacterized protein
MKTKLLHKRDGLRTFAVVFSTGDEVKDGLLAFASENRVSGAQFTAIGAFSEVTFAYFDWATKQYQEMQIGEQVEVLSLLGNFALKNGTPAFSSTP